MLQFLSQNTILQQKWAQPPNMYAVNTVKDPMGAEEPRFWIDKGGPAKRSAPSPDQRRIEHFFRRYSIDKVN